ncbi:hypothetical protein E2I00_008479 [Balaenoptera physalus]|uniref:TNFR-Cys domain-containing protein n=1 Tax=Balaenoptera physalus TaxID=9770 RepID=A0A643C4F6_BALPH|nr:hypothetical protein E2I00_008479 [Balaenoptera physalus]
MVCAQGKEISPEPHPWAPLWGKNLRSGLLCGQVLEPLKGWEPAAPVPQALLLLLLLGAQGQGSTPSPRCDCVHSFQKRSGLVCCRGCPAGERLKGLGSTGHYLKAPCTKPCGIPTCLPCPRGTFLAWENHHKTRCARCQACDEEASQVALKNCSAVADTHCGCKPGWFMDCVTVRPCTATHGPPVGTPDPGRLLPHPSPASFSPVLTHTISRTTGSSGDTHCGTCLPGFYEYGNSCATHLSPPDSSPTLLVTPSSSEKVCTVQLVGSSWTSGSPQAQEAPCPEVTWSWDQLPSRTLGASKGPEVLPPTVEASVALSPSLPLRLRRGPVTPRRGSRGDDV